MPEGQENEKDGPEASLFRRFIPEIDHRTTGEVLIHPDFARVRPASIAATVANCDFVGTRSGARPER